jgi:hypothetical protein
MFKESSTMPNLALIKRLFHFPDPCLVPTVSLLEFIVVQGEKSFEGLQCINTLVLVPKELHDVRVKVKQVNPSRLRGRFRNITLGAQGKAVRASLAHLRENNALFLASVVSASNNCHTTSRALAAIVVYIFFSELVKPTSCAKFKNFGNPNNRV